MPGILRRKQARENKSHLLLWTFPSSVMVFTELWEPHLPRSTHHRPLLHCFPHSALHNMLSQQDAIKQFYCITFVQSVMTAPIVLCTTAFNRSKASLRLTNWWMQLFFTIPMFSFKINLPKDHNPITCHFFLGSDKMCGMTQSQPRWVLGVSLWLLPLGASLG